MSRPDQFIAAALAIATLASVAGIATPAAAARRCRAHAAVCPTTVVAARGVDLPVDGFIAAPAAPYSYYYAYPAPYPYVYASHGCIVRSGIYDWAGYFKGYQVLRVAC